MRVGAEAREGAEAEVKGSRSEVSISSDSLSHTTELTYTFPGSCKSNQSINQNGGHNSQ